MHHDPMPEHLNQMETGARRSEDSAGSDEASTATQLTNHQIRLQQELDRLAWTEPHLDPTEALQKALANLASPISTSTSPSTPRVIEAQAETWAWPSFFGIYGEPRTWSTLVYLLLSLATGIVYFTGAITGLSLSVGLIPIVIGLPLLALTLGSCRSLAGFDARLASATLRMPIPSISFLPTRGETGMKRLGSLFGDRLTWTSLLYLLLQLPLGTLYFSLAITLITTFSALTLSPLLYAAMRANPTPENLWVLEHSFMPLYGPGHPAPMGFVLLIGVLSFLALTGSLHLILALGRFHGKWTRLAITLCQ